MMSSPQDQEFRSRDLADSLRHYLIGINTGGIAVVTALSKDLSLVPSITLFVIGIIFCGASLFSAQHRALRRRDAARAKAPEPEFAWYWRSICWNILSFFSFVGGAVFGIVCYQA
jgi:hypothetical protein